MASSPPHAGATSRQRRRISKNRKDDLMNSVCVYSYIVRFLCSPRVCSNIHKKKHLNILYTRTLEISISIGISIHPSIRLWSARRLWCSAIFFRHFGNLLNAFLANYCLDVTLLWSRIARRFLMMIKFDVIYILHI